MQTINTHFYPKKCDNFHAIYNKYSRYKETQILLNSFKLVNICDKSQNILFLSNNKKTQLYMK